MTARDSYDQAVIDAARAVAHNAIATGSRPAHLPIDRLIRAVRRLDDQAVRAAVLGPFQVASLLGCRVAVEPLDATVDDRAVLWLHDDRTRRMAATHLPAHGLRALGQHLIRCADQIDQHHPEENGDPACPPSPEPTSPARDSLLSPRTSSSPACP